MSYFGNVRFADSHDTDAFGRLRVAPPQGLFDAQMTYNLVPLQFEAVANNGGGGTATVAHDATNRCATMTFTTANTGANAFMQSYEYIRYQPGRSQAAFVTFNFQGANTNMLKFAGLSDGTNGVEYQLTGAGVKQLVLYSGTGNGTQTANSANWNLDKLDGSGASGLTINTAAVQIFVVDLQALYVGRVRCGFDLGGVIVYVHQFDHANRIDTPYIQSATLPIRCGMTATGASASGTMRFICSAVVSEGGQEDNGGIPLAAEGTVTAGNGADTHILSIRPKTTFNSITNRTKVLLDSVEILVTGNSPIVWKLCVGQALTTPTYANVNTTYSAIEFVSTATLSGTPAIVLQQGYCAATAGTKGAVNQKIAAKIPITLTTAAAVRDLGTVTLLVQGIGATSATRATFNWRELR